MTGAETRRLEDDRKWKDWGPYLSERQWGTVREDYSPHGSAWDYLPHDHARSRAYRWGEDGIGGFSDHNQRLCFALALWNGRDPIVKERLFGLTGPEGNHGEDPRGARGGFGAALAGGGIDGDEGYRQREVTPGLKNRGLNIVELHASCDCLF